MNTNSNFKGGTNNGGRSMELFSNWVKMKKLFVVIVIIITSVVLLEIFSFGSLCLLSFTEIGSKVNLKKHISQFHPIIRPLKKWESVGGSPIPPYQRTCKYYPYSFDTHTGYAIKPGAVIKGGFVAGNHGFICNSECDELPIEKPANEIRIFIFGGSTVLGSGSSGGKYTISAYLENLINGNNVFENKRVRVINAGVGGFFSFQEVVRFLDVALKYQPDMAIFFNGFNDYTSWKREDVYRKIRNTVGVRPNYQYYDYLLIKGLNQSQTLKGAGFQLIYMFNQYVPVLHYSMILAEQLRNIIGGKAYGDKSNKINGIKDDDFNIENELYSKEKHSLFYYLNNMEAAAGVCRIKRIKCIISLQPTLAFHGEKELSEFEKSTLELEIKKNKLPNINIFFNHAKNEFVKRSKTLNDEFVHFVDMTDIFKNIQGQIYVDDCHYNDVGNRIIAENLYNIIVKSFRLK
jgi:hypothetical protein